MVKPCYEISHGVNLPFGHSLFATLFSFFDTFICFTVITHKEKLLYSDWLRDCEFTRNLRATSVIRGK